MSKLTIATGRALLGKLAHLEETSVSFLTEDGRVMFEVSAGKDGRSINVRGVETCIVDGVLYSELLELQPIVANSIDIKARKYDY